ncbi:hypothetical protein GCM10009760_28370 [Kitasatospora kazusensis]|uniref:NAD-dependent epimerase/dehydratase domain-containing protein n=2 Tax=Kitasatospora kazusensis TaxID=407974 RepID=A0ABN2ZIM7_9ACTN
MPVEVVHGDLGDAASLRGICTGVDTVVHLASLIGGDAESCHRVNVLGTGALLAEAQRAGVRRIVQLSTTAVYRDGVHRGATESALPLEPGSVTSRTRLQAERLVLAAGGTVVRPHLVYGRGDTWVIPAVAELLGRMPHWIDGGRARVSMIAVDDLARALAALVLGPPSPGGGQVYHACHPEPVRVRDLLTLVSGQLGLPLPSGDLPYEQAVARLVASEGAHWARRLSLLGVDHWYESSRLWQRTGCDPGPGLAGRFADHAPWYRARSGAGG